MKGTVRPQADPKSQPQNFRLAAESDTDVILRFMRQLTTEDPGPKPLDEPAARAALAQFLRDPSLGRAWLICDGQTAVGYVILTLGYSLEFHGRDSFVDELFIEAGHRGRGWGRRTMEFVEAEARSLGVRAIHLEVSPANSVAYELYRRSGFEDRQHHLLTKRI
jgi:ribosomal protein S18 acetylase RimI-like enzyme